MQQWYPLVWIVFIICVFLAWFFNNKSKHEQRMKMIEKGWLQARQMFKTIWISNEW